MNEASPSPAATETPSKISLGEVRIPDEILKPDLGVLERYQAFSSELLRISLLAIPTLGFLLSNFFLHHDEKVYLNAFKDSGVRVWSSFALVGFGISIAFALAHRYILSDAMTTHIIALRLGLRNAPGDAQRALKAGAARKRRFILSGLFLAASSFGLLAGAIGLAIAIVRSLSFLAEKG